MAEYSIGEHFVGKEPVVRTIYEKLLSYLSQFGRIIEEPKKTSIHLVHKSALAGVETRKTYLLLNIKSDHNVKSPRIISSDQPSANRYHFKVRIESPDDLDDELKGWLREAYQLSG